MSYYVVIRGPLGVGKSTVSAKLAKVMKGELVSIDRLLDEHGLWESGRASEFLQTNKFAAEVAEVHLAEGRPVVFDGNFYWKSAIDDLERRLHYPHFVFTLEAPLALCVERDRLREKPYGAEAARQVFVKSTRFDRGVKLDATVSPETLVRKFCLQISRGLARNER
jgi:predicted kinase